MLAKIPAIFIKMVGMHLKLYPHDQDVNVDEDWKLITLWIGGNDLCAVCKGEVRS